MRRVPPVALVTGLTCLLGGLGSAYAKSPVHATLDAPARPAAPAAAGYPAGRYLADLTVPAGGIASFAIGVEGLRSRRGQTPVPADVAPSEIAIANDPFVANRAGPDAGASVPWGALAAALGALVALAAAHRALAARRLAT